MDPARHPCCVLLVLSRVILKSFVICDPIRTSCRSSHSKNSGLHDIYWPPPPLGITIAQQVIRGSRGGGLPITTSWLWKIGIHSRMNGIRIEPYPNCLVSHCRHFFNCLLRLSDTTFAKLNTVGFKHSVASWSWVLVASCEAYEPATLVMVERGTHSDKTPLSDF